MAKFLEVESPPRYNLDALKAADARILDIHYQPARKQWPQNDPTGSNPATVPVDIAAKIRAKVDDSMTLAELNTLLAANVPAAGQDENELAAVSKDANINAAIDARLSFHGLI